MKAKVKETGEIVSSEIWLPVVGSEKTKLVSNYGRVKSLDQKVYNGKVFLYKKRSLIETFFS